MSFAELMMHCRKNLGQVWVVVIFSAAYLISQVIIGVQLEEIGPDKMLALQVATFTAADYQTTFQTWEQAGLMPFYHSHLIFDAVHWIWYAIALAALLAMGLDAVNAPPGWNRVLVIPFVAGLCDLLENSLQNVFLSDPQFLTIVDPLPMISATASITKWLLAAMSLLLIAGLFGRRLMRGFS